VECLRVGVEGAQEGGLGGLVPCLGLRTMESEVPGTASGPRTLLGDAGELWTSVQRAYDFIHGVTVRVSVTVTWTRQLVRS
jgi:hypothetical protein